MNVHQNHILIDPLYEPLDMTVEDDELYSDLQKVYAELLSSFEMRKAAWQLQSGLLFEAFPGCTHTRRAHAIGCWLVGWHSLRDVRVETATGGPRALGQWLAEGDDLRKEFLLALLLHDVGHLPFSHSLEAAILGGTTHEDIGKSLISGRDVENEKTEDNYYDILRELLTMGRMQQSAESAGQFEKYYRAAKCEVRAVHDILSDPEYELDPERIVAILGPRETESDPRIWALSKLVDSEVDIDRIDHFLRDSYYSGVRFADYRIKSLLQNLTVCEEGSDLYARIVEVGKGQKEDPILYKHPCLLVVQENGIEHVQYLLTVRQFIYDRILSNPKNLKLTAALCMAVKQALANDPSLWNRLAFMTDPILLQILREDRFRFQTVSGYSALLQGEHRTEDYSICRQYLLKIDGTPCPTDDAEKIRSHYLHPDNREKIQNALHVVYREAERVNRKELYHPRVLVHQCRLPGANRWWERVISAKSLLPLGRSKGERQFFEWLDEKERDRSGRLIVWCREGYDFHEGNEELMNVLEPIPT